MNYIDENNVNYYFQKNHLMILDVQEKERSRIARELHDSSLQNLTHLIHELELSSMYMDEDPLRAKLELESCTQSLKQIIKDIRDTIFDLRPMTFDDLGFKDCLKNELESLKLQYTNCEIIDDVDDIIILKEEDKDICNLFLVTIYRVIQEALINSLKHSDASKIMVLLKNYSEVLYVEINDNGKGFDLEEVLKNSDKHFGMSIMKERITLLSGKIDIVTNTNGTIVKINIPKPSFKFGG